MVGLALLVVRTFREPWLRSVDRHFFRERYDAQRLLRSIAEQITRASNFEAMVPSVIQQIDEALHPEFVSVLRYLPDESMFAAADALAPSAGPSGNAHQPLSLLRSPSLACCRC